MPRIPPDHVFLHIKDLVDQGSACDSDHPDDIALYQLFAVQTCSLPAVEQAVSLYLDDEARHALNAAILCKATDAQLMEAFEISVLVLTTYRRTFFDRGVFSNVFEIKRFIEQLQGTIDNYHFNLYDKAYQTGPDYVLNRFRVGARPAPDVRGGLQEIFSDQVLNARACRGQALTSAIAKEAKSWGEAACSTANILLRMDASATSPLDELHMLLITKNHSLQPGDLPQPGPMLH